MSSSSQNELFELVDKRIKHFSKYYNNFDVVNITNLKNKIIKNTNPVSYGLTAIISVYINNNSNKLVLNDLYMSRNYALNTFIPENVVLFKAISQLLEEHESNIKICRERVIDLGKLWRDSHNENLKNVKNIHELRIELNKKQKNINHLIYFICSSWTIFIYVIIKYLI